MIGGIIPRRTRHASEDTPPPFKDDLYSVPLHFEFKLLYMDHFDFCSSLWGGSTNREKREPNSDAILPNQTSKRNEAPSRLSQLPGRGWQLWIVEAIPVVGHCRNRSSSLISKRDLRAESEDSTFRGIGPFER